MSDTNISSTSASERSVRRNAIIIAAFMVVYGLVSALYYTTQITGLLGDYVAALAYLVVAVVAAACAWFSYKDHVQSSMLALIGVVLVLMVGYQFTSAGDGPMNAFIVFVVVIAIAVGTLSGKWMSQAVIAGIVGGVLVIVIDLFGPAGRPVYAYTTVDYALLAVLVVVLVFILLRQFGSFSLRTKLIVTFAVVTLLAVGTIAYLTQRTTSQALGENVGLGLYNLASTQGLAIGNQLGKQIDLLYTMSINKAVIDDVDFANLNYTGDAAAIQAEIDELDDEWRRAVVEGPQLNPLIEAKLDNEIARQLNEFKRTYPDHVEVFLTDRYGALVASTDVTSDYYQADEEWWQEAYNGGWGGFFISPPVFDESAGVLSLQIAVPVKEPGSPKILGVLRTTYQFGALAETLGEVVLGQTGEVDLVFRDEEGVLMHLHEDGLEPVEPELLDQLYRTSLEIYSEFDLEGQPSLIAQSSVAATADTSLAYKSAVSDLGWWVIVHQDSEEALAPVVEQTRAIVLLMVVIVLLVSVVAIWLSGILAGPIARLTGVAEQVREGDLAARARVESGDEVGQLAATFNEMTARLRQTLVGLEQRVSERTRELTLSGEVGRALSQERDMDRLLADAVERIQSSFDLYYTQIYLPDPGGENLVLRSGTGDAGAELLARGHRLPLSPDSINGLAASEKRAVIVTDTETSDIFRPNPLLPETRSEMAVPLLVGERVVGVLDMQSRETGALSEEVLPAFESLAGQLAIAVENAALFTQAQQARAEVENQARRLTREGWGDFLDAVERSERFGYVYDQAELRPLDTPLSPEGVDNALATSISVTGEPVGAIQLERDPERGWTQTESELVASVADQVSRQIENLRLLARAESYRAEAETAARRLTREGWEDYLAEGAEGEIGFFYDQTRVKPLQVQGQTGDGGLFVHPLAVRGETVGELAFEGDESLGEEDLELINAIAERLVEHIEGLRLSAQTQAALAQTDALYGISHSLNEASNEDEILQAISQPAIEAGVSTTNLIYLDLDESGKPEWAEIVAAWPPEVEQSVPVGTRFYLPQMPFTRLWVANPYDPLLVSDVDTDERVDEHTRAAMARGGSRAMAIIPLTRGGRQVGIFTFNWNEPHEFSPQEAETYRALIGLGSPAAQTRRLFEQTQYALGETETLYGIIAQMNAAESYDDILDSLVERTLLAQADTVLLGVFDRPLSAIQSPDWIYPVAHKGTTSVEIAPRYPLSAFEAQRNTLFTDQPVALSDVMGDKRLDSVTRTLFQDVFQAESVFVIPLMLADQAIGFIQGFYRQLTEVPESEMERLVAVAGQAAIAVQSRLLLEQAQARALQEQRIREVTAQVFEAADVDTIMRRAVEQVGRVLNLPAYIYLGDGDSQAEGVLAGSSKSEA